jgi:glycosyltransferase involved in cell wall biosynthesis
MSYGNCCVVSDIPECADVVQEKGVTFRKGDVADLADKLQKLCDDPEAVAAYQQDAADYICNRFNWDIVTEQTLELYR